MPTIHNFLKSLFKVFYNAPLVAGAMVASICMFVVFGEIVDEVLEGDSHELDTKILLMLREPGNADSPLGPVWFEEMVRDFTSLGGMGPLTLITLTVFVYLILRNLKGHAFYLLATVITGTALSNLLKIGFDRPRPDLVPHGSMTFTNAFPSGHSFMATVVYLTLAVILSQAEKSRSAKIYILSLGVLISVIVGASRVYLGVHWPSDVLAGWVIGAGWALLFWVLAEYLKMRNVLKKRGDEDTQSSG